MKFEKIWLLEQVVKELSGVKTKTLSLHHAMAALDKLPNDQGTKRIEGPARDHILKAIDCMYDREPMVCCFSDVIDLLDLALDAYAVAEEPYICDRLGLTGTAQEATHAT
jgi:hypothetical protein